MLFRRLFGVLTIFIWAIFSSLKLLNPIVAIFGLTKITQSRHQFLSVNGSIIGSGLHFWRHFLRHWFNNLQRLHFWRHWFNMTEFLSKFGEQKLAMVNYACGFNQSETGKYFEWIIINSYSSRTRRIWADTYNQRGRLFSAHIRQVREE